MKIFYTYENIKYLYAAKNKEMGIPRFFKIPTPKRFNYNPIYWDPGKEDREQRVRAIKQEMGIDVELGKKSSTITRGSFRQNTTSKTRSRANRDSNRRLILIVIVLLLLAYILLYR